MKVKRRHPPAPHIPFISLADIAWQVIIFFFMAASFTKVDAMKVDPPSATTEMKQQSDKTTTVVAKRDGLSLDGVPTTVEKLPGELALKLKDRKKPEERVVILEGHKGVTFQRSCEVWYAIKKAGGIPMMSELDSSEAQAKEN